MLGISPLELLIILVVAVVVLGPEKLPKIMRTVTKVMSEFRRISTDLQRTMNAELSYQELQEQEEKRRLADEARLAALEQEQERIRKVEAELAEKKAQEQQQAPDDAAAPLQDETGDVPQSEEAQPSQAAQDAVLENADADQSGDDSPTYDVESVASTSANTNIEASAQGVAHTHDAAAQQNTVNTGGATENATTDAQKASKAEQA